MKKSLFLLCMLVAVGLLAFLGWRYTHSELQIEAQIIYNMGGPQPVARQEFYLLDKDPFTLRADDPEYRAQLEKLSEQEQTLEAMRSVLFFMLKAAVEEKKFDESKAKVFLGSLEGGEMLLKPHLVQTARTDFTGKAVFQNLRPGIYWLLGMTETRAAFALWNLKVQVETGENKLSLDQNNALYSK